MKSELEKLIEKWEQEKGSYIPNAPIYQCFIDEAKEALDNEKNKWIKIESEKDLPNHTLWLYNGKDIWQGELFIHGDSVRINTSATHYQPIQKPEPPLF